MVFNVVCFFVAILLIYKLYKHRYIKKEPPNFNYFANVKYSNERRIIHEVNQYFDKPFTCGFGENYVDICDFRDYITFHIDMPIIHVYHEYNCRGITKTKLYKKLYNLPINKNLNIMIGEVPV